MSAGPPARPGEAPVEVVLDRPAARWMASAERAVGVQLGSTQTEWLPDVERAFLRAAELHGGPVPWLLVFRLDPRFPLTPGFDGNLAEQAAVWPRVRHAVGAMSLVLEFDGLLRATMHLALRTLGLVTQTLPLSTHRTRVAGLAWLEAHRPPAADPRARLLRDLVALEEVEKSLGVPTSPTTGASRSG